MKEEFDLLSYIDTRLLEIDDLNQRSYAKSVLKDVFGELLKYSQETFYKIEQQHEQDTKDNKDYTVVSGILSLDEYDKTDTMIFPMCREDVEKREIKLDEMKSALLKGEAYFLGTIFVDAPFEVIKELNTEKKEFSCDIKTSKWVYKGKCYLTAKTQYEKMYSDLQNVFQRNGVRCFCTNTPYIRRFFNIYLQAADFYDIDDIVGVDVDFEKYKTYIKHDVFPVWNIQEKTFLSDVKPKPCEDIKQFCHVINSKRLRKECSYLVAEPKTEIYDLFHQGDLQIVSSVKEKKKWKLYAFTPEQESIYKYKFFSNAGRDKYCVVSSKADVFRFVKKLKLEDYVILKKVEVIEDHTQLRLYFEKVKEQDYMVEDVLCYIVTALQEECREYHCIGTFLEG